VITQLPSQWATPNTLPLLIVPTTTSNGVEGTAVAYDSDNNIVTLHVSEIYDD
jgi:hypothetical protein